MLLSFLCKFNFVDEWACPVVLVKVMIATRWFFDDKEVLQPDPQQQFSGESHGCRNISGGSYA
jgi:hypothetical protein